MRTMLQHRHKDYDSLSLAFLSLAAGSVDVLSFLNLGNVFASAMTGNTALLAIAVARSDWIAASRTLSALLGFIAGVGLATVVHAACSAPQNARRGSSWLLLIEVIMLGSCAVLWYASPSPNEGGTLYALILLSALAMGIQPVAARFINDAGINTIVFTSGLVHIVMSTTARLLGHAGSSPPPLRLHIGTLLAYFCGGVLAALLISRHPGASMTMPLVAVLLALGLSELSGKLERPMA